MSVLFLFDLVHLTIALIYKDEQQSENISSKSKKLPVNADLSQKTANE